MMSGGGLLSCLERHSLRPENGAELPRQFQLRHNLLCDQRLSSAEPRLGAHTNLDWARRVPIWIGHDGSF